VADDKLSAGQQEELDVFEGELAAIKELDFAFKRAASRMTEMQSSAYYQRWSRRWMADQDTNPDNLFL
jgi:predicted ATPase